MAVIAVGGEADTFTPAPGHNYLHETASGRFDANLSRGAMLVTQGVSELILPFGTTLATGWIHMRLYQEALASGQYITLRNTSGSQIQYRISIDSSGLWTVERYKSGSYTTLATSSAAVVQANSIQDIDIMYNRNTTGAFQVYRNGVQLINFSGDADTEDPIGQIRFEGLTTNTREMNISQVIVADENTIGWKLATLAPDGNGANTAWTNDYTAIDEFAYNAADFIETNSTNQVETFTLSDINSSFSTFNVKAVVVAARASNDSGSSVADIQAVVRTGGTNYNSPNLSLPKNGNEHSVQYVFSTNPNTTSVWTQNEVTNLEAGVRSV